MIPSTAPATIVVATPLEVDDVKELLSWAITILSHPNDTIIALHVIGLSYFLRAIYYYYYISSDLLLSSCHFLYMYSFAKVIISQIYIVMFAFFFYLVTME